jgi:hypothetical protein
MDRRKRAKPLVRPLRFGLRSADILFLMDIPLSGAKELYPALVEEYSAHECLPYGDGPVLIDRLRSEMTSPNWRYRVTVGAYDYGIYRYFPRKPVYLTMLRDPIDRAFKVCEASPTVNRYRQAGRDSVWPDSFWDSMLQDEASAAGVSNTMTRYLVGSRPDGWPQLSNEAMLEIAKIRLDELAFFGIYEEFGKSLRLLAHTFGWKMAPRCSRPRKETGARPKIAEPIRVRLEAMNSLDLVLYDYAVREFVRRQLQMKEDQAGEAAEWRRDVIRMWISTEGGLSNPIHPGRRVLGKLRREIVHENSRLEDVYVRVRKRILGW